MFDASQEGESYRREVISRFCSGPTCAISPHKAALGWPNKCYVPNLDGRVFSNLTIGFSN